MSKYYIKRLESTPLGERCMFSRPFYNVLSAWGDMGPRRRTVSANEYNYYDRLSKRLEYMSSEFHIEFESPNVQSLYELVTLWVNFNGLGIH